MKPIDLAAPPVLLKVGTDGWFRKDPFYKRTVRPARGVL
jgi:hypothetical protein